MLSLGFQSALYLARVHFYTFYLLIFGFPGFWTPKTILQSAVVKMKGHLCLIFVPMFFVALGTNFRLSFCSSCKILGHLDQFWTLSLGKVWIYFVWSELGYHFLWKCRVLRCRSLVTFFLLTKWLSFCDKRV